MSLEMVRDNQWWYSRSPHRRHVEHCRFVVLSIGARQCRLVHSDLGSDGRPTHSFKFLNASDRDYWIRLRGTEIDIEIIECGEEMTDLHPADGEELDRQQPAQLVDVPHVLRNIDTLFDAYIFVDWSAASNPKTEEDSIWLGAGAYDSKGILVVDSPTNPSTRQKAEAQVREILRRCTQSNQRVLIGFDFPYGYPSGWHAAFGMANDGDWRALWNLFVQRVSDDRRNRNNRCDVANDLNAAVDEFVGPYWSKPKKKIDIYPALPATRPACFVNQVREFREIELHLKESGKTPKSVWQLFGNGVVGSQAMLGIPILHRLRNERQLRSCSKVWPFETGWECPTENRPFILHAEIWPGAITVTRGLHAVKDAAQVLSYVYWAARLDVAGGLSARFNPMARLELPSVVQKCEGWILGD